MKLEWSCVVKMKSSEENPRMIFEDGVQNLGVTRSISRREVKKHLMQKKNSKAIVPEI